MTPSPGERLVAFVGDCLEFVLDAGGDLSGCRACLRTTLGAGEIQNDEIVRSFEHSAPYAQQACRDLPMAYVQGRFRLRTMLAQTGHYWAKAFLIDGKGFQHWPPGENFCVSVHPAQYRTANLVYCAWPRLFGGTAPESRILGAGEEDGEIARLEERGCAVIPPSGTLRDLKARLDHIVNRLGCRILHLLPVNPTPALKARFGRYGSPYATLDLDAVDPALVEFDQRSTGFEQFRELAREAHRMGARVFLDLVINHTGWGSRLQERHPEWFRRHRDGRFASPGAWGTVWEDLVELDHHDPELGRELAEVFLAWCRRGVDGFRCDAGYMVPLAYWRYITARVRQEFPDAVFLLEGLGGSWEATEGLLGEGGMQWAYSELFQNYSGRQIHDYLDYALDASRRVGLYLHYSETHDNPRLAARGAAWSLLRNRLCGLASTCGGYGFTCGVEWLATEKIVVHQRTGLNWGNPENLVEELGSLNRLLASHPCFFDGARLRCLSEPDSPVYVLERISKDGADRALVLANTRTGESSRVVLEASVWRWCREDLLEAPLPAAEPLGESEVSLVLEPSAVHCLSASREPSGLAGDEYRLRQGARAWMAQAIQEAWPQGLVEDFDEERALDEALADPARFLSCLSSCALGNRSAPWGEGGEGDPFPAVACWEPGDRPRHLPVPPGHWALFRDSEPFVVRFLEEDPPCRRASVPFPGGDFLACLHAPPGGSERLVEFEFESQEAGREISRGSILFLASEPSFPASFDPHRIGRSGGLESPMVLLANGRGAMARMAVDFGRIKSKYDCLLAANLSPSAPVDRHVLAKRIRLWAEVDGLISPLNRSNLIEFTPGPPARWLFLASGGRGRRALIEAAADMVHGENAVAVRLRQLEEARIGPETLQRMFGRAGLGWESTPGEARALQLSLTARVDIEDRSFHWETQRNPQSEQHFSRHVRGLDGGRGFEFAPAPDRRLEVRCSGGSYHPAPEWCVGIPHPVEASRGQHGWGDAYSPGWFSLPLEPDRGLHLALGAGDRSAHDVRPAGRFREREERNLEIARKAGLDEGDAFGGQLARALDAFVVRRGGGSTVIAGYPWFLDWGRDSLIAARGMLAGGHREEVLQLLKVFGSYERGGTLPNSLHGEDTSNRDTSDAPLWFGLVCSDLLREAGPGFLGEKAGERTLAEVLGSVARGYLSGTPNGIGVDPGSGLVRSPSHFTWMDTDHPAGTPREGYPVEIQALWVQLLLLLERIGAPDPGEGSWGGWARLAKESVEELFWQDGPGHYADCIRAERGVPAARGAVDSALRSNQLHWVALGDPPGDRARRSVEAALRWLLVPGAVRSLAPLPVRLPLPVRDGAGRLLNDPGNPFWGRYEGDEDTRRKPAYHNGTAWTWPLGTLCEAVLAAWDRSPDARAAARAWLGSAGSLMRTGCLGQVPEILDGEAPHVQRGCDAQAWGASEILRVWRMAAPGR